MTSKSALVPNSIMPPEKPVRQIGFRPDAVSKPKMLMANTVRAAKMRRGL